ncbi:hypothetical protein AB0E88_05730 [Streptomyces sp. NPDC028635]|uniref:hypothetical protein n=1 Tax=Streptomyces sp. NPDC028635 TaxID=3154800 RepID=UPI00340EC1FE
MNRSKALAFLVAAVCVAVPGTAGCERPAGHASPHAAPPAGGSTARPALPRAVVRPLPGVGPAMRARIPAAARQVLVVSGATRDTNEARVVLYEQTPGLGWHAVAGPWPARNGLRGWTDDHDLNDLRTPIGVFRLSNAGGLLPDPGSRLPYDQDEAFTASGTGHLGEPLDGAFDYVIAIDYNRVPGSSPLDETRPLGEDKGGGVWLHVDHGGPTNACVAMDKAYMLALLRVLDAAKEPVVVMGPQDALMR